MIFRKRELLAVVTFVHRYGRKVSNADTLSTVLLQSPQLSAIADFEYVAHTIKGIAKEESRKLRRKEGGLAARRQTPKQKPHSLLVLSVRFRIYPSIPLRKTTVLPSLLNKMSNNLVGTIYQQIINEVIEASRVDFEDQGVGEDVLDELRMVRFLPLFLVTNQTISSTFCLSIHTISKIVPNLH